jgi:hypothetical protein
MVLQIELSSQFNSSACLKHIQKAHAVLGEPICDKIRRLGIGEAYVRSSKVTGDSFARGAVKIKSRLCITQYSGSTKTVLHGEEVQWIC